MPYTARCTLARLPDPGLSAGGQGKRWQRKPLGPRYHTRRNVDALPCFPQSEWESRHELRASSRVSTSHRWRKRPAIVTPRPPADSRNSYCCLLIRPMGLVEPTFDGQTPYRPGPAVRDDQMCLDRLAFFGARSSETQATRDASHAKPRPGTSYGYHGRD